MENLYNYIYKTRIKSHANNGSGRVKRRLLDFVYRQFSRFADPLVTYEVNGFEMQLPFSHKLPFYLKEFPAYAANLARLAEITRNKYPDFTFIDVGANIGDSLAFLRKAADFPVLCIEGDTRYFEILKKNATRFSNVKLLRAYVGEKAMVLEAATVHNDGSGHLVRSSDRRAAVSMGRLPDLISEPFASPRMIKIDTDGYDCKVIRGAFELLERSRPVLFFEYDPYFLAKQNDDGISIFRELKEVGYEQMLVYDNFGYFMFSSMAYQESLVMDLHQYFSGHQGKRYCDICIFHHDDTDIFHIAKEKEAGSSRVRL